MSKLQFLGLCIVVVLFCFPAKMETSEISALIVPTTIVIPKHKILQKYFSRFSDDWGIYTTLTRAIEKEAQRPEWLGVDWASLEVNASPEELIAAIVIQENRSLSPFARGGAGEYGLMQIMPFHIGSYPECGTDIFDIGTNVCYGVNILFGTLARCNNNLRCALLKYNGCVTGKNAPNCFSYPDRVEGYVEDMAF